MTVEVRLPTVMLEATTAGNGAPAPENRQPAARPLLSVSKRTWIVRTEMGVLRLMSNKPTSFEHRTSTIPRLTLRRRLLPLEDLDSVSGDSRFGKLKDSMFISKFCRLGARAMRSPAVREACIVLHFCS